MNSKTKDKDLKHEFWDTVDIPKCVKYIRFLRKLKPLSVMVQLLVTDSVHQQYTCLYTLYIQISLYVQVLSLQLTMSCVCILTSTLWIIGSHAM